MTAARILLALALLNLVFLVWEVLFNTLSWFVPLF